MPSNESFREPLDGAKGKNSESAGVSVTSADYIETSEQIQSLAHNQAQSTNQLLDGSNPFQIVDEEEEQEEILHSDVFKAVEMFNELDHDGNRFLTQEEITQTLRNNPDLDEDTTGVLGALAASVDVYEELSNDEAGDENDGLSVADLYLHDQRLTAAAYAEQNIYEIDANGDAAFSREELMDRLAVDPKAAPYLSPLINQFDEIEDLSWVDTDSGSGITNMDFLDVTSPDASTHFHGPTEFLRADEGTGPVGSFVRSLAYEFGSIDDGFGNDFITEEEAVKSLDSYDEEIANLSRILFASGDTLSQLSDDEWGEENDGVTRRDLQAYEEQSNRTHVYNQFRNYDLNNDSRLAKSEIESVLEQTSLTGRQREALEYVRDNFVRISDSCDSLKVSQLSDSETARRILVIDNELEQ